MLHQTKSWLGAIPWSAVVQKNEELCRAKGFAHTLNSKTWQKAQRLWDQAQGRSLTLGEALEVCRKCNDLVPFVFACDQTFIGIGQELTDDLRQRLPPVEGHILRQTVANYIAGAVRWKELERVFRYCERLLVKQRAFGSVGAAVTVVQPQRS